MLRQSRFLYVTAVLIFALISAGCATGSPVVMTGEAIDAIGYQFLQTGNLMDRLHAEKKITNTEYGKWRSFTERFKVLYPSAVASWQAGQGAAATKDLMKLKDEIRDFYLFGLGRK